MTVSECNAKKYLESKGFSVNKIEESSSKSCDFLITGNNSTYLMEVKQRELSEEEKTGIRQNEIYTHPREILGYDDTIKKRIKKGVSQLNQTGSNVLHDFKLLWFDVVDNFDSYQDFERILATAYGMRSVYHSKQVTVCFYFTHSAFFTHKELDGIIVIYRNEKEVKLRLLVNNYANNYLRFRSSDLLQVFGQAHLDPSELSDDEAIMINSDIDRNDEPAVLNHLSNIHGFINPTVFDLQSQVITLKLSDALLKIEQ